MPFKFDSNIFVITTGIVSIFELVEYMFTKNIPWLARIFRNSIRWLKRKWRYKYGPKENRRLILNFSAHSVLPGQLNATKSKLGWITAEVINIKLGDVPENRRFTSSILHNIDKIDLLPREWQTLPLVVILPGYANACSVILAELHGRLGYFPDIIRLRPAPSGASEKYEVAEIIELQEVRNDARSKR